MVTTDRSGVVERIGAALLGLLLIWMAVAMPGGAAALDPIPGQVTTFVMGTALAVLAVLLPVRRALFSIALVMGMAAGAILSGLWLGFPPRAAVDPTSRPSVTVVLLAWLGLSLFVLVGAAVGARSPGNVADHLDDAGGPPRSGGSRR